MEFEQLEQLVCIEEEKTISAAAEKLHISQPALTRSMQRLEKDLGFPLFERTRNSIALSAIGQEAVKKARRLLKQRDRMCQDLQQMYEKNLLIRLAGCAPMPLKAAAAALEKKHPGITTECIVMNTQEQLLEALEEEGISALILAGPVHLKDMVCVPFLEERLYACLPENHPLASQKEIRFSDINGESILQSSYVGFWMERTVRNLPDSRLLMIDSQSALSEIAGASDLIRFKTNLTLANQDGMAGRIPVKISDEDAWSMFFLLYPKKDRNFYAGLENEISGLNWEEISRTLDPAR